jgi:tripartite-type tricarboxylate transporter receptor subunit TctC
MDVLRATSAARLRRRRAITNESEEATMLRIVTALLFTSIMSLPLLSAAAQYPVPNKPVRIIVPFSPGGGTDLVARLMQPRLEKELGAAAVVIDNRTGAGGTIGVSLAAEAEPDGHTLLVTSASFSFQPGLYKDLPYDAVKDFKPISMLITQPLILGVHPSMPVKTLKDLLALARKRPGEIYYGNAGVGSNLYMTSELFKYMAGIDMTAVQYRGGGPVLIALAAGEVHAAFMGMLSSKHLRDSGKVRALAVSTKERCPALPDVPSIHEAGVPGYDKPAWTGMLAPAGVIDEIIDKVYAAAAKVLKDPTTVGRLAADGVIATATSPKEFTRFVHAEIREWTDMSRQMKLPVLKLK